MYLGPYQTVIDEAGRITIPQRFRELMRGTNDIAWTITRGYGACLYLYTASAWQKVVERADQLDQFDPKAHAFLRFLYGCARYMQLDRQGRMVVPVELRELMRLKRDVMLVGLRYRLELWDKSAWDAYQETRGPDMETLAAELLLKPAAVTAAQDSRTAEEKGGPNVEHR